MLRFARRVAEWQLAQIDRWIAQEERRQAEQRRGEQARPPVPDWVLEVGIGQGPPVYVHVGGCYMAGRRLRWISREEAVRVVADGVEACPHCRADTALGILD
jgi:hypothetical protein